MSKSVQLQPPKVSIVSISQNNVSVQIIDSNDATNVARALLLEEKKTPWIKKSWTKYAEEDVKFKQFLYIESSLNPNVVYVYPSIPENVTESERQKYVLLSVINNLNQIFQIDSLKPETKYSFNTWFSYTWPGFRSLTINSPFKTSNFYTPPHRLGQFSNDINDEMVTLAKKNYNISPHRFLVLAGQGHGKSTTIGKIAQYCTETHISPNTLSGGVYERGTKGCKNYPLNHFNLTELQGFRNSEITHDSTLTKLLDGIVSGDLVSFDGDLTQVLYDYQRTHREASHQIEYLKTINGIIFVIQADDEDCFQAGIDLYRIVQEKFPLLPKVIILTKLDNISATLDLTDGNILDKLRTINERCGVDFSRIYPGFPPNFDSIVSKTKATQMQTYYYNKLILDLMEDVTGRTSEIRQSMEDYRFKLTCLYNELSFEITVAPTFELNDIRKSISEKIHVGGEFCMFQIYKGKYKEMNTIADISFHVPLVVGFNVSLLDVSDFGKNTKYIVGVPYNSLLSITSSIMGFIKEKDIILFQSDSDCLKPFSGYVDPSFDYYYGKSSDYKEIKFCIKDSKTNNMKSHSLKYIHAKELIQKTEISKLLENPNLKLLGPSYGKLLEIRLVDDMLSVERDSSDRIILEIVNETQQAKTKLPIYLRKNSIRYRRVLEFSDEEDKIDLGSLIKNLDSNSVLLGVKTSEKFIVETYGDVLQCEKDVAGDIVLDIANL